MLYERMPLEPLGFPNSGLRLPLFGGGCGACTECQTVCVRNPANPCETAELELCVDAMGCLSICVRRAPQCCERRPRGCRRSCDSWRR